MRALSVFIAWFLSLSLALQAPALAFVVSDGPASATAQGNVTTGTQTFAGDKTFTGTTTLGSVNITALILSSTLSVSGTSTFNKTAETGSERLITGQVSDNATDLFALENGTATGSRFSPLIRGLCTSTSEPSFTIVGQVSADTGSNPVTRFSARNGASTLITTRPLFEFSNHLTAVLSGLPLNSGANMAFSWGTQAGANPAVTGATGSTRSIGTRLIFQKNDSATEGDYSLGWSAGKLWVQLANSSADFEVFGAATLAHELKGNGDHNLTGNLATTTAGKGISIKEGSNAKMGAATLVGGTVTVSTTAVTANSRIFLTKKTGAGTRGILEVGTITAGTSFVINSTDSAGALVADTSVVQWIIVEAG